MIIFFHQVSYSYVSMSTRWCCLPDHTAKSYLIVQPSLFAVGDWFTALFCMAVYENACFSYWCGNHFQMWWGCLCLPLPLLHTHSHISVAVLGIHFLSHGKGTKIDRKSREMLEFLSVFANACVLSSWGLAKVHQEPHDVYHMCICSSEDRTSWINLHRLFTFVILALLKCWILLGFFIFDYFTCIVLQVFFVVWLPYKSIVLTILYWQKYKLNMRKLNLEITLYLIILNSLPHFTEQTDTDNIKKVFYHFIKTFIIQFHYDHQYIVHWCTFLLVLLESCIWICCGYENIKLSIVLWQQCWQ